MREFGKWQEGIGKMRAIEMHDKLGRIDQLGLGSTDETPPRCC
jgi:hypothetical protein